MIVLLVAIVAGVAGQAGGRELGGTRPSDNNAFQFDHPEMGPFRGVISGDSLVGEFTQMKHRITLLRGQSIWQ